MSTWWICVASASTCGVPSSILTSNSIVVGMLARSRRSDSSTTGPRSIDCRRCSCCRLNVRICRTSSVARSVACATASRCACTGASSGRCSRARSMWPPIAVRMLLKSCAIPPASVPMASSFCERRTCSSRSRRAVMSLTAKSQCSSVAIVRASTVTSASPVVPSLRTNGDSVAGFPTCARARSARSSAPALPSSPQPSVVVLTDASCA